MITDAMQKALQGSHSVPMLSSTVDVLRRHLKRQAQGGSLSHSALMMVNHKASTASHEEKSF